MALLEVESVSKRFGGVWALQDVSLRVEEREIVSLIGPNGAGKTSFFNCVTGLARIDSGKISFGPERRVLAGLSPDRILREGLARTFQNLRIFKNMTLLENVSIGFHSRTRYSPVDALFRTPRFRREESALFDRGLELLRFVGLEMSGDEIAGNLPYGSQKRLEIARALACGPKLLLLDEPVAGMNPTEKDEIAMLVRRIRDLGMAVLLIEHDMKLVMPLSDRVVVLDEGRKIAEGRPHEIQSSARVIEAYLGEGQTC